MGDKKKIGFLEVVTLIVAIVTVYFQISPPKNQQEQSISLILFVSILLYVGFLSVIDGVSKKVKFYIDQITTNSQEIKMIKDDLNRGRVLHSLDKRISILEHFFKDKKGNFELDTRWVLLAILLILFFLYLRSIGLF